MPLRTVILLVCFLCSLTLRAEEPTTSPQQETKTASSSGTTNTQSSKEKNVPTNKKSTAVEFDPSEEISEDLSVPFPVDI